jgi:hypothetical protein
MLSGGVICSESSPLIQRHQAMQQGLLSAASAPTNAGHPSCQSVIQHRLVDATTFSVLNYQSELIQNSNLQIHTPIVNPMHR